MAGVVRAGDEQTLQYRALIAIEVAMLGALTAGAGVYFLMNFFKLPVGPVYRSP